MLKLGIVRTAQLARRRTWFGAEKFASVLLLRELAQHSAANGSEYDVILRLLQMGNGTWKDSAAGRLRVVDTALLDVLRTTHGSGTPLRVLDLGVASGVTSVELFHALRLRFTVDYLATDLWRDAIAVRHVRTGWTVVLDRNGTELQHIVGPFVLPGGGRESLLYPVNRLLRSLSRAMFVPRARSILRRYDSNAHDDFETTRIDAYAVTKLPLLSASCLELCRRDGNFRFASLDILQPFGLEADVVRAMNIITPAHFGDGDLRHAIDHCVEALRPGGLLIIGRSPTDDPSDVTATIYVRRDAGVAIMRRLNGGCEVESLLADHAAASAGTGWPDAARRAAS